MGGVLAALTALRDWGQPKPPHLHSHFDCDCNTDSTSSDEPEERDKRTWLQKRRPEKGKA